MNSDPSQFRTTRWTLVREAGGDSPEGREALRQLCDVCYAPVVAFISRDGRHGDSARDLAHEFFAAVLAGGLHGTADQTRGRFRSYLLGAVKHFLANHRRHAGREMRGGGAETVPIGPGTGTSPGIDPPDLTAFPSDALFDREWALAILGRGLVALEQELASEGRAEIFTALRPWLTPGGTPASSDAVATRLGLSAGAFKVAVHRMRKRFRQFVRAEVAATLNSPDDLDDEMRYLIEALER